MCGDLTDFDRMQERPPPEGFGINKAKKTEGRSFSKISAVF
jgi:hypothetical protein